MVAEVGTAGEVKKYGQCQNRLLYTDHLGSFTTFVTLHFCLNLETRC